MSMKQATLADLDATLVTLQERYQHVVSEAQQTERRLASKLQDFEDEYSRTKEGLHQQTQATTKAIEERYQQQAATIASRYEQALQTLRQQSSARRTALQAEYDRPADSQSLPESDALMQAKMRYDNYVKHMDALEERLNSLVGTLPAVAADEEVDDQAKAASKEASDPLAWSRSLSQAGTAISKEVLEATQLTRRLLASGLVTCLIAVFCLSTIMTVGWLSWQFAEGITPFAVIGGCVIASIAILAWRDLRGRRRKKYLQDLALYLHDLRGETACAKRLGMKQLHPGDTLNNCLDHLIAEQEAEHQRQSAGEAQRRDQLAALQQDYDSRCAELHMQRESDLQPVAEQRDRSLAELQAQTKEQRRQLHEQLQEHQAACRQEQERESRRVQEAMADLFGALDQLHRQQGEKRQQLLTALADDDCSYDDRQYLPLATATPPADKSFFTASESTVSLPLGLELPHLGHMLLRAPAEQAFPVLHQAMLRLMQQTSAGRVRFTLIDPTGLGEAFGPFLQLFDYDGRILGDRVWTKAVDIECCLQGIAAHAEKIVQTCLRDRYADLASYNSQAGALAEAVHVLVVNGFPDSWTPAAVEVLNALIRVGQRCGIHVWIRADANQSMPKAFSVKELHGSGLCMHMHGDTWHVEHVQELSRWSVQIDQLPDSQQMQQAIMCIGQRASAATQLALPMPTPAVHEFWNRDNAKDLRIPIGSTGADHERELILGRGTEQHLLIGGRTGSGKSTLLHALISGGALWYGPEQLNFYLIDFKKGVEFKRYANAQLPHARVIAVESDREYALSALRHLDSEMERRGRLFRDVEVQDLAGFRQARSDTMMPRVLLVIDEFHEFFIDDDAIAQEAALLLERFVRQGRAFGVHVVLGSQSIGGSMTLARSAIGQIGVRIALQCSDADSQMILSDDNLAARSLERPGQAIYNDRSGLPGANTEFQIYWVDETEQEAWLQTMARRRPAALPPAWVFEGNAPADLTANSELQGLLEDGPVAVDGHPALRWWLGEPNAIKGPTELDLSAQAGANVLVVGQHRQAVHGMVQATLASLAARCAPGQIRLLVVDADGGQADAALSEFARHLIVPVAYHGPEDIPQLMHQLSTELQDDDDITATLLIVLGLGRLRSLRQEDEFAFSSTETDSPARSFGNLLRDGPERGLHTLIWAESATIVQQSLQRSTLRQFSYRLLFQMGPNDSSDLIDNTSASRLGVHHALLCDMDTCQQEKFRPYRPLDLQSASQAFPALLDYPTRKES